MSDAAALRVFDVFLSHNSREKAIVERIAERLKREGVEPWLDKWCLTPGGDWQDELADGLRRASSCAVFIGPYGIGNWERLELKLATQRMANDRDFHVFLVLLPDLPEPFDTSSLPPFLSTRTWVDLRKGVADPRAFQTLINAVKRVAPGACPLTSLAANLVRLFPQLSAIKALDELGVDQLAERVCGARVALVSALIEVRSHRYPKLLAQV